MCILNDDHDNSVLMGQNENEKIGGGGGDMSGHRQLLPRNLDINRLVYKSLYCLTDTICRINLVKVIGPFVETPRIFLCMRNINFAEILAWKNDYYLKIISDRGLTFVTA